ncbi:hypothetical protein M422DRAFT_255406 [Sphaerobolus stellatus SS14]|uniref:Unplaced genomic scaffold SPHSTscaffold_61, whole genome shotgun sequence n=1 Tax=Sphaerobolus stellatus (strain SS14) TaxID=990650 RepID=A0A0C9V3K9_SPHS4|nr:hypothetical protein M422DRAFT_255406 [Sphaerobolus stellatus SS14]
MCLALPSLVSCLVKKLLEQITAENLPKDLEVGCDEVEAALKKIKNNEFPSSPAVPNVPKEKIIGQKA